MGSVVDVVVNVVVEMMKKVVVLGLFGEEGEAVDGGLKLVFGELLESERERRWWTKCWPRVTGQGLAKGCGMGWLPLVGRRRKK